MFDNVSCCCFVGHKYFADEYYVYFPLIAVIRLRLASYKVHNTHTRRATRFIFQKPGDLAPTFIQYLNFWNLNHCDCRSLKRKRIIINVYQYYVCLFKILVSNNKNRYEAQCWKKIQKDEAYILNFPKHIPHKVRNFIICHFLHF